MDNEQVILALAEQAYMFHLLVKLLRERGFLQAGEPIDKWNEADFQEFLRDFRLRYFPGAVS